MKTGEPSATPSASGPHEVQLSVVVVNWNAGSLLRRCLESVRRHPPRVSYEIIVVDNASSDDSVAEARALADVVIENAENLGFARANNQAFARSHAPLLFLLNPDAEVTAGAMDTLMTTLAEHPRAGVCGPRIVHADGSLQPSVWPDPVTPSRILLSGLGLWRLLPRARRGAFLFGDHWSHDEQRSVPMVFGAAMLVRRETVEDVGALDERFPLYGEDDEWCLRIRRGGWTILFEPRATVVHDGGVSSRKRWSAEGKLLAQQEALLLLQRLTLTAPHRIGNMLAQCVVSAAQSLRHPRAREPRLVLKSQLRGLAREVRRA